jgi:NADPH:quinone reductase
MKSIRVHQTGGPEALRFEDTEVPKPGPGEAVVRNAAIGVNFIDTYHRTGLYKLPLPFTPGMEAAGTVECAAPDVEGLQPGHRVAYAMSLGSYAEYSVVPAWKLVPIPDNLDFQSAAALMLQGMTAHYLVYSTFPLAAGQTALVHAAAGGVGLILTQLAKIKGATVYGTAGSEAKALLARQAGADEVILYDQQDFESEIKRLTGGKGVHVAYDSVGIATYEKSMRCLRPRGYLVLYGQSSGSVPPLDPQVLATGGSLFLTRPVLGHYVATRDELLWRSGDLFQCVADGKLKLRIEHQFPLSEAMQAHLELEGRRTTGKILLIP